MISPFSISFVSGSLSLKLRLQQIRVLSPRCFIVENGSRLRACRDDSTALSSVDGAALFLSDGVVLEYKTGSPQSLQTTGLSLYILQLLSKLR